MWGELAKLISHLQKSSDIRYTLAGWHAVEGACPGLIRLNSCTVDNVATEFDLRLAKLALGTVQGHTCLLNSLQGRRKTLIVLVFIGSKDEDVVHHADSVWYCPEYFHHPFLLMFRSRGDSEW